MTQFVGYHLDGLDPDNPTKSVPVSTGATREEAQRKAIMRIIGSCVLDGYIGVQQRDDLSADDFAKVTEITDDYARKRGLDVERPKEVDNGA